MLSKEENELITSVGPGTPMGEVLRRYWQPALLSWELPGPDCPSVRVKLLGEQLIAFRDTSGRLGLLEEFCAHRSTSLWLGRNEENGLRCVWHGWKYDVTGQCVDQLNEPGERSFASKIRLKSYPTVEMGGVIWAYMGPPERMPPPPKFGWTQADEAHRQISKVRQECSWLQALEGGIDQSHVGVLHRRFSDTTSFNARGGAPAFEVETTDYGLRYFAIRPNSPTHVYARGYHFIMPYTQVRPNSPGPGGDTMDRKFNPGHTWVPIDDEHCFAWNWAYSYEDAPLTDAEKEEVSLANGPADVDQETYPVRIRLTRTLTTYEAEGLASVEPGLRSEGDAIVLPAARLDDVARDVDTWSARLEQVQTRADQLEGELLVADQRRADEHARHGSHLRSQQVNDRGLH